MTSQTMLAPVDGEQELEQLEAAFLRSPSGVGPLWETGASATETPVPFVDWPADDGPTCWITRYRTRRGCCG